MQKSFFNHFLKIKIKLNSWSALQGCSLKPPSPPCLHFSVHVFRYRSWLLPSKGGRTQWRGVSDAWTWIWSHTFWYFDLNLSSHIYPRSDRPVTHLILTIFMSNRWNLWNLMLPSALHDLLIMTLAGTEYIFRVCKLFDAKSHISIRSSVRPI